MEIGQLAAEKAEPVIARNSMADEAIQTLDELGGVLDRHGHFVASR